MITMVEVEAHPRCVDCGYDLHGLGEAVRCPECGRVNVPEAYRREVWAMVDRGTWFFSNPFQLFRKRPPGWWWSLDRPGDVMRSTRFALTCLTMSALLMGLAVAFGDTMACKTQWSYTRPMPPGSALSHTDVWEHRVGLCGVLRGFRTYTVEIPEPEGPPPNQPPPTRSSLTVSALSFAPWWGCIVPVVLIVPALLVTWLGPAGVGLCTQIRKGLPRFARAPATVVSGCNYEAHRLIYVAILVVLWVVVDVLIRRPLAQWGAGRVTPLVEIVVTVSRIAAPVLIMLYGALGWVGALRSDFTRMLIQSRGHAVRIVLMYAIGLPLVTAFAVLCLDTLIELAYF